MGTVRVKWLLMLMCVMVCAVLAPLITLAHNGMRPNDMMFGFTQGSYPSAVHASTLSLYMDLCLHIYPFPKIYQVSLAALPHHQRPQYTLY